MADEMFAALEKIYSSRPWEADEHLDAFEAVRDKLVNFEDETRKRFLILGARARRPDAFLKRQKEVWTLESLTHAFLAVRSFYKRHGRFPASLDAIDRDLLAGPMTSGWTGRAMTLRLDGERPLLSWDADGREAETDLSVLGG